MLRSGQMMLGEALVRHILTESRPVGERALDLEPMYLCFWSLVMVFDEQIGGWAGTCAKPLSATPRYVDAKR